MPIYNLDKVFHPQSIAVVGASRRSKSVGQTVLRNLLHGGFGGDVYPVNPKYEAIDGTPCFADVTALPKVPDLAVISTPARTVPEIVRQCGEVGIEGLVILSAGFRETGEAGQHLEQAVQKEAAQFSGMRIVGPNCLGVMAPHIGLNVSYATDIPPQGNVAFISQSGALCTAILDCSRWTICLIALSCLRGRNRPRGRVWQSLPTPADLA